MSRDFDAEVARIRQRKQRLENVELAVEVTLVSGLLVVSLAFLILVVAVVLGGAT